MNWFIKIKSGSTLEKYSRLILILLVVMNLNSSVNGQSDGYYNSNNSGMNYDTILSYSKRVSLPKVLRETSGIIITTSGNIWSHNDSGNPPILYQLNHEGKIIKELKVTGATNFDWEDITIDQEEYIYIGDFGNNKSRRKRLQIYKIPNQDTSISTTVSAEKIEFKLKDLGNIPPSRDNQNFDIESMFAYNDSLFLITKNHSVPSNGYAKVYTLPAKPGRYEILPIDSIHLGNGQAVTGAAINHDEDRIALLSHDRIWIIQDFKGKKLSESKITQYLLPTYSQKEGICFDKNSEIVITDELFQGLMGGEMLFIKVSEQ